MSGPEDGKYVIRLAADPKPFIGVDSGAVPVKPVITEPKDGIWAVRKLPDGNYTLSLEQTGRPMFCQHEDDKLVVRAMPPFGWAIRGWDDEQYTIEVPSGIRPTRAWTVKDPKPQSPVTIDILEIPLPNQLWKFNRFFPAEE